MSMYTWRDWRKPLNIRETEDVRSLSSYAIQSQYSASEKLLALARGFQDRLCPEPDVDLFFREIFDILTARGAGLDTWGLILQMPRTIEDPEATLPSPWRTNITACFCSTRPWQTSPLPPRGRRIPCWPCWWIRE